LLLLGGRLGHLLDLLGLLHLRCDLSLRLRDLSLGLGGRSGLLARAFLFSFNDLSLFLTLFASLEFLLLLLLLLGESGGLFLGNLLGLGSLLGFSSLLGFGDSPGLGSLLGGKGLSSLDLLESGSLLGLLGSLLLLGGLLSLLSLEIGELLLLLGSLQGLSLLLSGGLGKSISFLLRLKLFLRLEFLLDIIHLFSVSGELGILSLLEGGDSGGLSLFLLHHLPLGLGLLPLLENSALLGLLSLLLSDSSLFSLLGEGLLAALLSQLLGSSGRDSSALVDLNVAADLRESPSGPCLLSSSDVVETDSRHKAMVSLVPKSTIVPSSSSVERASGSHVLLPFRDVPIFGSHSPPSVASEPFLMVHNSLGISLLGQDHASALKHLFSPSSSNGALGTHSAKVGLAAGKGLASCADESNSASSRDSPLFDLSIADASGSLGTNRGNSLSPH
jgi:hypothetical protein